mmetsp:Transcript_20479/g.18617  ORF Transcript_20479/g.18617 Transcript_20479/m.18617 type:complete len:412 (-) Transcript_20479:144-1379(-)
MNRKSFDSTISSEDESNQLSRSNSQSLYKPEGKEIFVINAVNGLNHIVTISGITLSLAILLATIHVYTSEIPIYVIFIVFLIGHVSLIGLFSYIINQIYKSIFTPIKYDDNFKFNGENDKRFALIQYTIYNVLWSSGGLVVAAALELLLFLYYQNILSLKWSLIPLYVFSICTFLSSLSLKYVPYSIVLSALCIFIFTVLLNIKLTTNSLTWIAVLIPVWFILHVWLFIILGLIGSYALEIYILHDFQFEALGLYLLSITLLIISSFFFMYYNPSNPSTYYDLKASLVTLLFGVISFFLAYGKVVAASIALNISRMGAIRPHPLVKLENGGWDIDKSLTYDNHVLLGEIEVHLLSNTSYVINRLLNRYIFGYSLHTSSKTSIDNSDEDGNEEIEKVDPELKPLNRRNSKTT